MQIYDLNNETHKWTYEMNRTRGTAMGKHI